MKYSTSRECLLFFPAEEESQSENIEAVKQIATKCTHSDGSLQVAIGGGYDPHISRIG